MKNQTNRRRVFRLRLPNNGLLKATINEVVYEVIELSEFGIVVTDQEIQSGDEDRISGSLQWTDGTTSEFSGEVGRLASIGRVIWKIRGIEMPDVVREQRHLLAKFTRATMEKRSA